MDAIEFLNVRNRMCNSNSLCDTCILFDKNTFVCEMKKNCIDVEETVAKVEKWVKENSVKTRASEFLKMFPNMVLREGIPVIWPCILDKKLSVPTEMNISQCPRMVKNGCIKCSKDYWTEVIE